MNLVSVTLYSGDWHANRRFYVDFLGMPVTAEEPDRFLAMGPLCIDPAHGRPPSQASITAQVEDLDAYRSKAAEFGYAIELDEGQRLSVLDPDGRRIWLSGASG